MIELIIAGAGLAWLGSKVVNSGDKAAKRARRWAEATVRDVVEHADAVLQPCAAGRAPHTSVTYGETYSDGTVAYFCRVCGATL